LTKTLGVHGMLDHFPTVDRCRLHHRHPGWTLARHFRHVVNIIWIAMNHRAIVISMPSPSSRLRALRALKDCHRFTGRWL